MNSGYHNESEKTNRLALAPFTLFILNSSAQLEKNEERQIYPKNNKLLWSVFLLKRKKMFNRLRATSPSVLLSPSQFVNFFAS